MNHIRRTSSRGWATGLITPLVLLTSTALFADDPPKKPAAPARPAAAAPKAAAPAPHVQGAAGAAASHLPGAATHTNTPAARPGAATPAAAGSRMPAAANGTRPGATSAMANRPVSPAAGHNGAAAGFKSPGRVESAHNGTQFQRDNRGNVREIHHGDLAVHRGPANSFRSERVRPDGSRLVGYRHGGYVEHSFRYGGHDVYRRNYYYGGRAYSRYYNPYAYHGVYLSVYAPAYYYAPGFYGYAYAPWAAPVPYSWGWGGSPWYGYYGGYFTPYPVYASPSLWLTDYLVAQSLQAAYLQQQTNAAAQQQANAAAPQQDYNGNGAPAPLTPEVKQQIAEEVRRQIALENSERQTTTANAMPDPASSGIARILNDNSSHVFVASAPLNLVSAGGECAITEGDVLQVSGAPAASAAAANATVLASKGKDCPKGSTVQVAFADLQEMQNHMRETIDQGLGELQQKQGTGGLPALPPSAATPPTQAGFATVAPPPDPTEATDVNKQIQEASQAEQDALAGALSGPSDSSASSPAPAAAAASTATVSMGQSMADVERIMGKPKSIANLPTKTIYVYDGLKVVFVNGKVSDVQ
jgi:hypothetical protein